MLKKAMVLAAAVFILLMGALASVDVYYIRDGGGVECALWNGDEAFLFVNVIHRGYSCSYLGSLVEVAKQYFYLVPPPADQGSSTVVFRITPSEVQRYTAGEMSFDLYTPFEGGIYADQDGALWRWAGSRFEPTSAEDQRHLDGIKRLSAEDFSNVHGWSGRHRLSGPLNINLRGNPVTVVVTNGAYDLFIDLQRAGQPPEQLWHLDERPRRISQSEYRSSFPKTLLLRVSME